MRRFFSRLARGRYVLAIIALLVASLAHATNLRGRVVAYNPAYNTYYPAGGVELVIVGWNGRGWFPVARAMTMRDGMYYLTLVPGNYYIQVPGNNYPLTVHPVPNQDIPQITLH